MRTSILCLAGIAMTHGGMGAELSQLWGESGEKWTPQSRLPDFSYAGYRCGEKPLPMVPPGISVKTFGAKGDGIADDTQAFLDAIEATSAGAIEVPAGRYKITKILEIKRSGVVLRGAGPKKSTLFFPVPLNDIKPNWSATTSGARTSGYSWSGGFIWITGDLQTKSLTPVIADALRGDTALNVESATRLSVGQRVQIYESDLPDNSLAQHLYSGEPGNTAKLLGTTKASLVCRITQIDGNRIQFDRPLRWDLKLKWKPQVRRFEPTVAEVGVENLCFEFPNTPYMGHFKEVGFNAIALSKCSDCWVRNIRIVNADSGIFSSGLFCTIQGVTLESNRTPDRTGSIGHHGLSFYGSDSLFADFDFHTQFIHDISVDGGASGNVIANGKGVDLCLDHHKRACYENLFTNLDAGAGTHLWRCGGGDALGKHCGARGTFWNIRARQPQEYPAPEFGPDSMNFVALQSSHPSQIDLNGKWLEAIAPANISPQDIHQAQLARRLGRISEKCK